jgi:hypothetical protein
LSRFASSQIVLTRGPSGRSLIDRIDTIAAPLLYPAYRNACG